MNQGEERIFASYVVKGHNRRIQVGVAHTKTGPAIVVMTRTLQGSWKDRRITQTEFVYGAESFLILSDLFNSILNEPLFHRSLNPHRNRIQPAPCRKWVAAGLPKL